MGISSVQEPILTPEEVTTARIHVPSNGDTSDWVGPKVTTPSPSPVKNEATKMLDELFRKTKTVPSVYWLPLTHAEVSRYMNTVRFTLYAHNKKTVMLSYCGVCRLLMRLS